MINIREYIGDSIKPHLDEVARWRLQHFREFPYLYAGTFEYEREYLQGMIGDNKSMLLMIDDQQGQLVGISTGVPLCGGAEIVGDAPKLFRGAGLQAEKYYYFGEVIIAPDARGKSVARKMFDHQEARAASWGFASGCLAVVVREKPDARQPKYYVDSDKVWCGLGYSKTQLTFEYEWPTIQVDGSVRETSNSLVFWTKDSE